MEAKEVETWSASQRHAELFQIAREIMVQADDCVRHACIMTGILRDTADLLAGRTSQENVRAFMQGPLKATTERAPGYVVPVGILRERARALYHAACDAFLNHTIEHTKGGH